MNAIHPIRTGARLDLTRNCTLETYAMAKALPPDFLRTLGLETVPNPYAKGRLSLSIPYFLADSSLFRNRLRTAQWKDEDGRDDRMRWDRLKDAGTILYGLDCLPEPGKRLFLVEGESDTQTLWFHGFPGLGLPGAGNFSPDRDDEFLVGREVVAFMERDQGGKAVLRRLSGSAHRDRIRVAVLEGFKDVSDMQVACPERFRDRIEQAVAKAVPLDRLLDDIPELDERAKVIRPGLPPGFRYRRDGQVEHIVDEGDDSNAIWEWLCSPLEILAATRDRDQRAWGILLRVQTPDGHWHRCALPSEHFAGSGEELRRILLDLGLRFAVGSKARAAFMRLLSGAEVEARALCVPHVGWHGPVFVLPEDAIGETGSELVVFQPPAPIKHAYRTAGSLEHWQRDVARYAVGNSRLVLAISAAFAGPLLQIVEMEGGGLHFRASSSTGKTTILQVAGSVWGGGGLAGYLRRWRATDNALEGVALAHCDTLLTLDELAEVDAGAAGKAAYMLANGQGKARAGRSGQARPAAEWRLLFLSTGEIGLSDKVAEDNRRRVTAGQEVRIVDLPADAEAGFGIFEDLHGFNRPADLADHLKAASARNFGHAARRFLEFVTADIEGTKEKARRSIDEWLPQHCPVAADGQVTRVAKRFALVSAAGELAITMGILPWAKGEADMAAARCFEDWLAERGGVEPAEVRKGIANLRAFIERHETSRFASWNVPEAQIRDRAGFLRKEAGGNTFYLFPEAFREACSGLNPGTVARALVARGILEPANDGKHAKLVRLPGAEGPRRIYVITPKLFEETENTCPVALLPAA